MENGGTLRYRVTELERDLERFQDKYEQRHIELAREVTAVREAVAVLQSEFRTHTKIVQERLDQLEGSVDEDVRGLKKTLIGAGSAVFIAAITFAITSLAVYGSPG